MASSGGRADLRPLGVCFDVAEGETVMHAALHHGYSWPSSCGGQAGCGLCFIRVLEGGEHVSPPTAVERDALRRFRGIDVNAQPEVRLACQVSISGPVTIRKVGVRVPGQYVRTRIPGEETRR